MPYTMMALATRRPGMTPTAFKTYYEETHIPLIKSITGDLFPITHTRHYLQLNEDNTPMLLIGDKAAVGYDAIAELTFTDKAAFDAYMAVIIGSKEIMVDADEFLDQSKNILFIIDEAKVATK